VRASPFPSPGKPQAGGSPSSSFAGETVRHRLRLPPPHSQGTNGSTPAPFRGGILGILTASNTSNSNTNTMRSPPTTTSKFAGRV
jgi:hypothetical protein